MEISIQLHDPTALFPTSVKHKDEWVPDKSGRGYGEKKSLSLAGIKPRSSST